MSEQFWIVVRDDDAKTFNVQGPSTDDRAVTNAVYDARQAGREVSCSSSRLAVEPDRQALIDRYARDSGLTYTDNPIVSDAGTGNVH